MLIFLLTLLLISFEGFNVCTANCWYFKPFQGDNLFDPKENVRFGTDYIYALEKKLGSKRNAAVAYNWGYGNTKKWLEEGADLNKLPEETRNYIKKLELDQ